MEIENKIISIKTARKKLIESVNRIEINVDPRTHLITYPNGIGKTHHVAELIRNRGWKTLWLCPTHKHAREIIDKYFQGVNTVELKSRLLMIQDGEIDCPRETRIRSIDGIWPHNTNRVCYKCHKKIECKYYENLRESRTAKVILGMHSHLHYPRYLKGIDCLVIDEDFSNNYNTIETFSEYDIRLSMDVLESINRSEDTEASIKDNAAELIKYSKEFLAINKPGFTVSPPPSVNKDFVGLYRIRLIEEKNLRDGILYDPFYNPEPPRTFDILELFGYLSKTRSTIFKKDNIYDFIKIPYIPDNMNMIILDASGTEEFYRTMLNREIAVHSPSCYVAQTACITQFMDGLYPKSSLINKTTDLTPYKTSVYNRLKKLIETIIAKHNSHKIAICSDKKVEEFLKYNSLVKDSDNISTMHYYSERGIDYYKDHDVLIVVGEPMISFEDIAKRARVTFNQDWNDVSIAKQMKSDGKKRIEATDPKTGRKYSIEIRQFPDKYVQCYYEHLVISEIYQMVGRIRPYEGKTKYVYVICNIPIPMLRIDERTSIREFIKNEAGLNIRRIEMREIKQAIDQLPRKFKISDLADKLSRARTTQKHHLREVLRNDQEFFKIRMKPNNRFIEKIQSSQQKKRSK